TAKILLMDITGFISEQEKKRSLGYAFPSIVSQVHETLQKAEKDSAIAGVIIRINSPGGTITASDIIHHDITRFKERKKVPVYSCITSVGTSGAYYIVTSTDNITAHPTSITGSIGVIIMKMNIEGLMSKIGVSELTIKSGDKKDLLSPFRPATPEEKQIIQALINQFYKKFVDKIMARSGNTLNRKQIESLADGRVYSSEQALEVKLIDQVGYLDDTITEMKKKIGVTDAKIVNYSHPDTYKGTIYSSSMAESSLNSDILSVGSGFDWFGETQFLYLWRP
ncbi:MAG TPA: signal peptide peptidase SppA, partial [Bacteroidales bacterium]|nr:signal peptide peptidase SppA [Bacteroidales bacterium]